MAIPDLSKIEAAVQGVLEQESVELVDLKFVQEHGRMVLRFFLDKTGGITLDDCAYMSNRIGSMLDMTDLIPTAYTLEVSSPGVDRVLKREKDFLRFVGHRAKVRLKAPLEGRRNFMGYVKTLENGSVVLEAGEQTVTLPLTDIEEARLSPDLEI
ncbi:MAG: ribosome maturation factor RimP [Elusimicrobia bacterium]|nr:ribosome maturation factor RimP [Elusimicrobiota bacterium]